MIENSSKKKIVITDDHPVVRHAIRTIIESKSNLQVVGEADDIDSCINLLKSTQPDLLVLDLGLKDKTGIEVLYQIKEQKINIPVLVLSMYEDEFRVKQALNCGAKSYLLKESSPDLIIEAIEAVLQNKVFLPPQYRHLKDETTKTSGAKDGALYDPLYKLSSREREVFYMLVEGKPNRIIAKQLYLSPRTIETHRARLIKKLGLNSTADLVRYAIRNNLLSM